MGIFTTRYDISNQETLATSIQPELNPPSPSKGGIFSSTYIRPKQTIQNDKGLKTMDLSGDPGIAYGQKWFSEHTPAPIAGVFNAWGNLVDRFENSAVGKFIGRGSEKAVKTMFLDDNPDFWGKPITSTGNGAADTAADIIGTVAGFIGPVPGGAVGPAGGLFKAGEAATAAVAPKALPRKIFNLGAKVTEKGVVSPAESAIGMGLGGGLYGAGKVFTNDMPLSEIPKEAAYGLLGDLAGQAAGKAGEKIFSPLFSKIFSKSKPANEVAAEIVEDTFRPQMSRTIDFVVDEYGMARPAFMSGEITSNAPAGYLPKPRVEPDFTVDEFGTAQPGRGIAGYLPGKEKPRRFSMPNRQDQLMQAQREYNESVEVIQNYLQHNDVLAKSPPGTTIEEAIAQAERATGVNLREALAKLENAEVKSSATLRDVLNTKKVGLGPATKHYLGSSLRKPGSVPTTEIGQVDWRLGKPKTETETPEKPLIFKRQIEVRKPQIEVMLPGGNVQKTRLVKTGDTGEKLYDVNNMKDTTGFKAHTMDVYRIFRDVFGKDYDRVKKVILDPFDDSKKANIEFQQYWLDKLKTEIVDNLGIKKGSKESALVQQFGEGQITLNQLKKTRPNDWQKIVEADKWFRKAYDDLLDRVNAVRSQIYPNNPDKIIPKRKDYYRHFRELTDLTGLKNIFDTPANIDPKLEYISEFTLPKSRWLSIAQRRGQGPFKNDAVGGFLNYIPSASYSIHIDPHIGVFERLAKDLADATGEEGTNSKHLNKFINFLRSYAQDLAGKTNPADRFVQNFIPGGRKAFAALNWLNSRIKANVILGNLSSTLAQLGNVPQGIAYAKQYSVPGAGRALKSIFTKNNPVSQSGFMLERYANKMYRQFDTKWFQQPQKAAEWLMETADKVGTSFIWNSVYSKGLAEGVANPIKYADDVTRSLVAGRGIGEVPLLQKSRMYQLALPFTLEMANAWRVMKDFVNAKDFGGLAILLVANHMLNKGMEAVRGSGVVFDPIQAMIDAATEEDISPVQRAGRVAGEVLSNMPMGQTIASVYPEYGTTLYGYELPTRKEMFGRNDPTRFGVGLPGVIANGLSDPGYMVAFPFGGNQIKKTLKGINAIEDQGIFTRSGKQLKYPVDTSPINAAKGVMFGPSGFSETREYYDNNLRPLTEKQTKEFQEAVKKGQDPKMLYNDIQRKRAINSIENEIKKIKKDENLSPDEKLQLIEKLQERAMSLLAQK